MSKTARLLTTLSFSFFLSTGVVMAADNVCKDRCTAQMKACSKAENRRVEQSSQVGPANTTCLNQLQACMSRCAGLK
jgi:hypothetical protein